MSSFNLGDADYHQQTLANAVAAAAAAQQYQRQRSPAPMFPGPSTIPTNFSSGQINSPEALQQFQTEFWKAHIASIEDNMPDFKLHLLPLARIKKVMKSDPDVKVQMISAEAPILFSKACEIFITEITQRAWMNAEENKRRTLQRQDVSFAAQRSEMFDFLIDVVPREEFASKKNQAAASSGLTNAGSAVKDEQQQQQQQQLQQQVQAQQQQQHIQQQVAQVQQLAQQPQPQQQQQQHQPPQQPPQQQQAQQQAHPPSLYTDPAFQQYYAHQLAEAAAGYPQTTTGSTPEQRQAYYQQIEREQLQWLQRQTNIGVSQQQQQPRIAGSDDAHMSPPMQQQQQQHDMTAVKGEPARD
ncbi:hypothetical protein LPJ64_004109 [Coemansia asiatica]|uniref:Core Histone H2A/H2B/H3 domain-containing protein n=1 Tax=Coemansia asiatica TaxID=1052880 RepID=A0A9W7XKC7_9FUNG|nr:hypothetical protein LPJ64_004109 [Coemansia asiatica]